MTKTIERFSQEQERRFKCTVISNILAMEHIINSTLLCTRTHDFTYYSRMSLNDLHLKQDALVPKYNKVLDERRP